MDRLKGKTAIITGGATGIGEAISKKFAREGAKVLVVGMPQDPVEQIVKEIEAENGEALGFPWDISVEKNIEEAVNLITEKWGKIDILINHTGVFAEVNPLEDYSTESFENLIRNDVLTTFLLTKMLLPELKKTRGCIVSTGSEAAISGLAENAAYGGTKGFIHAFMKGVAAEQASNGVRMNIVAPGSVDLSRTSKEINGMTEEMEETTMHPNLMGRKGTPEEVANVYLFLASKEASNVTGAVYTVGGGINIVKGPPGKKIPEDLRTTGFRSGPAAF